MSEQEGGSSRGLVLIAALIGGVIGCIVSFQSAPREQQYVLIPAPHLIAKTPEATPLHFAMVHDVLHQRYPVHGSSYYLARNRARREALRSEDARRSANEPPSLAYLTNMDDLAVGHERLGEYDEAIDLMRQKLNLLKRYYPAAEAESRSDDSGELSEEALALYRAHANLGTFLIHAGFKPAINGDPKGRDLLLEGIGQIRRSLEINPGAHFDREEWQIIAVLSLLEAIKDHGRLLRYDIVGGRLDEPLDVRRKAYDREWVYMARSLFGSLEGIPENDKVDDMHREAARESITPVNLVDPASSNGAVREVPFDEPVLGILGMWTLGGGPNPHFALALGGLMERVGQRYLAWDAYQRAADMSERFWPDSNIQQSFIDYCYERQQAIEQEMVDEGYAKDRYAIHAELQTRHEQELARGQQYQEDYQEFEEGRLREGVPLDHPDFHRPFHEQRGPIASPIGQADLADVPGSNDRVLRIESILGNTMLGAGIAGLLVALLVRFSARN
ncbi:hypothetical protein Pan216_50230 [Planctomycetes bacterium Pan216]|uniref:Uncharacterized protein n=1 Tax=Kolteria novifilia TaxID=2527975 RepID=A0A518BAX3_9BACT|nr:hypothetical protein Pan216_50230 [Planctomycetes bacterium Pan216]